MAAERCDGMPLPSDWHVEEVFIRFLDGVSWWGWRGIYSPEWRDYNHLGNLFLIMLWRGWCPLNIPCVLLQSTHSAGQDKQICVFALSRQVQINSWQGRSVSQLPIAWADYVSSCPWQVGHNSMFQSAREIALICTKFKSTILNQRFIKVPPALIRVSLSQLFMIILHLIADGKYCWLLMDDGSRWLTLFITLIS